MSEQSATTIASERDVTIALDGEYDMARAGELEHALLDIDRRTTNVTADLSRVTFMDSAALRALLEVRSTLVSGGRTLRLRSIPPAVATLLDITRTGELFDVDGAG